MYNKLITLIEVKCTMLFEILLITVFPMPYWQICMENNKHNSLRDTSNIVHKTQNEEKQNHNQENKKDE